MNGIDFSFARISAADIKGQGYGFACRYLASSTQKRVSVAEITDFKSESIALVLVWEDEANAALGGFNQGQHDAQEALNQAGSVGWPGNLPIYFSIDFDATEAQQGVIDDYLRGAASVIGLDRVGVYGGYYVVMRCLNNGTATFAYQTTAWSGGQVDPRVHIYQNGQSAFGGNADVDEARQANFGQWSLGGGEIQMLNEGDIVNIYQTLLGRAPDAGGAAFWLGKQWHDLFYTIVDGDEFKQYFFVNDGDVVNLDNSLKRTDAATIKGQVWKSVVYNYIFPNVPVVQSASMTGSGNIPVTVKPDVTPPPKPLPHLDPMPVPSNGQPTPPQTPIGGQQTSIPEDIKNFFSAIWKVLFG